MSSHLLSNAKLAYLLSTCHKLNDGLMTVMTQQYEKSKTVATRHYFVFNIVFRESRNNPNFIVSHVNLDFFNNDDNIIVEALQYHNDSILLDQEMKLIYNNLIKNDIKLDVYQIVAIYSIATLIKIYKSKGFKYIFIPCVINYGRSNTLLHQTGIIIDIADKPEGSDDSQNLSAMVASKNEGSDDSQNLSAMVDYPRIKFIYYEPYGLYTKYDKSYKEAVGKLFQCFDGFMGCKIDYTTYHDLLGLTHGIQKILLDKNNLREAKFNEEYNVIIALLKKEFPDVNFERNDTDPKAMDTKDKTVKIMDLLFNVDYFNVDNLSRDKKNIYFDTLNTILTYYCGFNSKTCVSITITELNKFFRFSQESNLQTVNQKITEMYKVYDTPIPNNILMTDIYSLLDLFRYKEKIKDLISSKERPNVICQKL